MPSSEVERKKELNSIGFTYSLDSQSQLLKNMHQELKDILLEPMSEVDRFLLFAQNPQIQGLYLALGALGTLEEEKEKQRAWNAAQRFACGVISSGRYERKEETKLLEEKSQRINKPRNELTDEERAEALIMIVPQPLQDHLQSILTNNDPKKVKPETLQTLKDLLEERLISKKERAPALAQVQDAIRKMECRVGIHEDITDQGVDLELKFIQRTIDLLPNEWYYALQLLNSKDLVGYPRPKAEKVDSAIRSALDRLYKEGLLQPIFQPSENLPASLAALVSVVDSHSDLVSWPYVRRTLEWEREIVKRAMPEKEKALTLILDGIEAIGRSIPGFWKLKGKKTKFGTLTEHTYSGERIIWENTLNNLHQALLQLAEQEMKARVAVETYTSITAYDGVGGTRKTIAPFAHVSVDFSQPEPVVQITGRKEVTFEVGIKSMPAVAYLLEKMGRKPQLIRERVGRDDVAKIILSG